MLLRLGSLLLASIFAATPASADWFESGFVNIVANLLPVEAEDIDPGDVVDSVQVGSPTDSGELTVVGEGDVDTRQSLGQWTVRNGQGNIQSTFGSGGPFRAEGGDVPEPEDGVIDVLNSDVEGNFIAGERGTVRLTGSAIKQLTVADGGSAYVSLGSTVEILETRTDAYVQIDESSVVGFFLQTCYLDEATILVRDSRFACANLVVTDADMDVLPVNTAFSELEVEQGLSVSNATLDVGGGTAETGWIDMGSSTPQLTGLRVAGTSWVNHGTFELSGFANGPGELLIGGGSDFLQKGKMIVRSPAGANGLVVTGAGTELDAESDLLVGQTVVGVQTPTVPGTLSVGSGGVVIVRGTLVIGASAVLNLDAGGTVYAAATEIHGTVNENGGALIVPEAGSVFAGASASASLAAIARRRRSGRAG
jgi:hypothetical protein